MTVLTTVLALFVLLPLQARADFSSNGTACSALFEGKTAIDAAYRKMHDEGPDKFEKAQKLPPLLNRAFTPLAQAFGERVDSLSEGDIERRILDFKEFSPIYGGEYHKMVAQIGGVDRRMVPNNRMRVQDGVRKNASQAIDRFRLDENNDVTQLNEFLYVDPSASRVDDLGIAHQLLGAIVTPVGDYGREFAEDSLKTTQILFDIATHSLKGEARATYALAPTLLQKQTARGKAAGSERVDVEFAPLNSLLEGIATYHQLVSLSLSSRVAGVKDGAKALALLTTSGRTKLGLVSEMTMRFPMGVVGPATLSGFGFKDAMILDRLTRKLKTSPRFESLTERVCGKMKSIGAAKGVCPMSGFMSRDGERPTELPKTGIQIVADAYLKVFNEVRAERLRSGE